MDFEQIGIVSYTAVLVGMLPGSTYAWSVNQNARAPTVFPQGSTDPVQVQLQFDTTQPGSDVVTIDVVGGGNDPIVEVILVPLGQRQRLVA